MELAPAKLVLILFTVHLVPRRWKGINNHTFVIISRACGKEHGSRRGCLLTREVTVTKVLDDIMSMKIIRRQVQGQVTFKPAHCNWTFSHSIHLASFTRGNLVNGSNCGVIEKQYKGCEQLSTEAF